MTLCVYVGEVYGGDHVTLCNVCGGSGHMTYDGGHVTLGEGYGGGHVTYACV